MKTNSQNKETNTGVKVAIIENVNSIKSSHAMVTQVGLKNGSVTAMVTLFDNSLIGFEEVKIGVNTALQLEENVMSEQSTLYTLNNGKLDKFTDYDKEYISHLKKVC